MAIEVLVENYFKSKCFYCGYGFHMIWKLIPNPNPSLDHNEEIVICDRLTKECKFTPIIKME
jgi:hypothetical protein